jgi:hypothetical protein
MVKSCSAWRLAGPKSVTPLRRANGNSSNSSVCALGHVGPCQLIVRGPFCGSASSHVTGTAAAAALSEVTVDATTLDAQQPGAQHAWLKPLRMRSGTAGRCGLTLRGSFLGRILFLWVCGSASHVTGTAAAAAASEVTVDAATTLDAQQQGAQHEWHIAPPYALGHCWPMWTHFARLVLGRNSVLWFCGSAAHVPGPAAAARCKEYDSGKKTCPIPTIPEPQVHIKRIPTRFFIFQMTNLFFLRSGNSLLLLLREARKLHTILRPIAASVCAKLTYSYMQSQTWTRSPEITRKRRSAATLCRRTRAGRSGPMPVSFGFSLF